MNQPAGESLVEHELGQAAPSRTFHVLTTGDIRGRHAPLLRNPPSQVAVEEVADIGAVLARLGEEPPPDLVVLGWTGSVGDDTAALLRLHDHDTTVPLLIIRDPQRLAPPRAGEPGPEDERLDTVRDAIERLVTSIESLVTAAAPAPDGVVALAGAADDAPTLLALRRDECRVMWRGQTVNLSLTEFRVVARMAADVGSEVSHRELYDVIKSDGFLAGAGEHGYRGSVRATIKRIRAKFRQVDGGFDAIRSYPGFGYRWIADERGGTASGEVSVR